jgi:hypothetical protein|tara:strand:- start:111 stop:533 length:423 start_codon:yes stop_codon:yes gene_type:complete
LAPQTEQALADIEVPLDVVMSIEAELHREVMLGLMHWKETDLTAPAEAQGRYPTTTAVPEVIRHTEAIHLVEPIKAQLLEPLPIEVPVALLQGLRVEPTEARLPQDLQVEPIEATPVAPHQDHRVALTEVPAAPTVPVEV